MFEKLFGKVSDVVYHTIAPYAVERRRFLEHCHTQGCAKTSLEQVAGILLTAAIDLQAHGGLDVDQAGIDAAAIRIERVRSEAGFAHGTHEYRRAFLRYTTRWLLFTGHLQDAAPRPRPYTALLDDFDLWMREERGLSPGTLGNRRWHLEKFLDWLHERERRVSGLELRDLDAYLQHLHGKGLSRVTIKIHTNAIRALLAAVRNRGILTSGGQRAAEGRQRGRVGGGQELLLLGDVGA